MLERNRREYEEIISSIGLVTRVWATLESSIFKLFMTLAGFPPTDFEIAGVIFYTPSNTETRISLVDKLVTYRCELNRAVDLDDRLRKVWEKAKGKIDALKNTRNAIIHGTVSGYAYGDNLLKQGPRLNPAFGDWLRLAPPIMAKQIPGLGSNEIKNHEQAVWRVNDRMRKLDEAFQLRLRAQHGPDPEEAIRKLLELLPQLENRTNSQNNQDKEPPEKPGPLSNG
jgi:hypothetical protein